MLSAAPVDLGSWRRRDANFRIPPMGKFHELDEFERGFAKMSVAELWVWHAYWMRHAMGLSSKGRKQAMTRVRDIEKAIAQKGGDSSSEPVFSSHEILRPGFGEAATKKATAKAGRIMYIECKAGGLTGAARIGRVRFSQTGRTLYYKDQRFQSLKGRGFKSNYYDVNSGEDYWISGPKRDGSDRLYGGRTPIEIDEDVREEYWRDIRRQPKRKHEKLA